MIFHDSSILFWVHPDKGMIRRGKGSRLVGGTQLVVFLRPNRPQFEKTTSRDPLSSRDPFAPWPFSKMCRSGKGPGRKGGLAQKHVLQQVECITLGWLRMTSPNPFFFGVSLHIREISAGPQKTGPGSPPLPKMPKFITSHDVLEP